MKGCYPFNHEQIRKMLNYFERKSQYVARNKAFFLVGITTGFRITELLSIKVKDVFQNDKIVDRVYIARASMKGGKKQTRRVKKKKLFRQVEDLLC